jgi:hypothetical protein
MTEDLAIRQMIEHCERLFPKTCANCQRAFPTFKVYLQNTERLGKAISYDMEFRNFTPVNPMGALATAKCPCDTTLALSSEGMPLWRLWPLMLWGRMEAHRRSITPRDLLEHLCDRICQQVLAGPDDGGV